MSTMAIIWLIAIVIFSVIEMATPQLVSIWFAGGALLGLVLELTGVPSWVQMLAFAIGSGVLVAVTRPLYHRYVKKKAVPTNADSLIGKSAVVTVPIDNANATGQVKAAGQIWSALSDDAEPIEEGETVNIREIRGVRLIVSKIK